MKKKSRKNKYLLFVFTSWLIARLKWTFEISRLAIFKSHRKSEIRYVIQQNRLLADSYWNLEQDFITLISYNYEKNSMLLQKFPKFEKN